MRETEEEVGLPRANVTVAGALEDHGTVSGYRVTPIVGVIRREDAGLEIGGVGDVVLQHQ